MNGYYMLIVYFFVKSISQLIANQIKQLSISDFLYFQIKEPEVWPDIERMVRPCVDHLLAMQFASGNFPSSVGSSSGDRLVQWCHGAPGWVYMFIETYNVSCAL